MDIEGDLQQGHQNQGGDRGSNSLWPYALKRGCSIAFQDLQDKILTLSYAENTVINACLLMGRNREGVTGGEMCEEMLHVVW